MRLKWLRGNAYKTNCRLYLKDGNRQECWEHSGSKVECLTRDRGAARSNLTGVTALCP